jgi:homocitrate synthase NifV
MIFIIDRTIAELGENTELRSLLQEAGADLTEETAKPSVPEFIINDIREARTMALASEACRTYGSVRLRGFDDILLGNCRSDFEQLNRLFNGNIEFAPTDACGLSTAAAVEWALMFQKSCRIVTTFGGIGGYAAFEEVVMALRLARVRKVGMSYKIFPQITALVESAKDSIFSPNKPIIGSAVYKVKSGIHVDGILKQPKCYLPFLPEDVGRKTEIVLSKHSGKSAVISKLEQYEIRNGNVEKILAAVKSLSIAENRNVTDEEFIKISAEV